MQNSVSTKLQLQSSGYKMKLLVAVILGGLELVAGNIK